VIDVFLFAVVIHVVENYRANMRHPSALWDQVEGHVDPALLQEGHVPEPLVAIICGTAPAAIFAALALPNGWRASSPFDIRWASLYLVLAAALWYGFGRWAETRDQAKLRRFAQAYIVLRVVTTPMSMSFWGTPFAAFSHYLLLAVWLGASVVAIWYGDRRLSRRINGPRVPAL